MKRMKTNIFSIFLFSILVVLMSLMWNFQAYAEETTIDNLPDNVTKTYSYSETQSLQNAEKNKTYTDFTDTITITKTESTTTYFTLSIESCYTSEDKKVIGNNLGWETLNKKTYNYSFNVKIYKDGNIEFYNGVNKSNESEEKVTLTPCYNFGTQYQLHANDTNIGFYYSISDCNFEISLTGGGNVDTTGHFTQGVIIQGTKLFKYTVTVLNADGSFNTSKDVESGSTCGFTNLAITYSDHYEYGDGWTITPSNEGSYISSQSGTSVSVYVVGTVTVQANQKLDSHTITYVNDDNNGNRSTESWSHSNAAQSLKSVNITGYVFGGWHLGSAIGEIKTTYSPTDDATFYATWTPRTYTLTIDPNDGVYNTQTTNTVYTGTDGLIFGTSNRYSIGTATRTGYTFKGWYVGNNQVYNSSGYCTTNGNYWTSSNKYQHNGNLTVKANWESITYSISYDLNDSTGSTRASYGTNHPTSATYDTTFTVNNPKRTGYTFNGWNISGMDSKTHTYGSSETTGTTLSNCKETSYKNLRSTSGTVTFTAQWTAITYKISYNGNGYTSGEMSNEETHDYDETFNLTQNTYERLGYNFSGWATTSNGNKVYDDGQSVSNLSSTNNATVTLYAQWTAKSYTINYHTCPGTALNSKTISTGESFASTMLPTTITRVGYHLDGYYYTSDFQSGTKVTSGNTLNVSSDGNGLWNKIIGDNSKTEFTLYAKWIANEYTISYDTVVDNNKTSEKVTYDSEYTFKTPQSSKSITLNFYYEDYFTTETTKTIEAEYSFLGWSINDSEVNLTSDKVLMGSAIGSGITTTVDSETTTYTLGGSTKYSSISIQQYTSNSTDHWTSGTDFTADKGFNFSGNSGTSTECAINDSSHVNTYSYIYVDNNNNVCGKNLTAENNETVNLYAMWDTKVSITFPYAYKEGYTFLGWSEEQTATKADYKAGEISTIAFASDTTSVTYYPVFEQNSYTITINNCVNPQSTVADGNPTSFTYENAGETSFNTPTAKGYTFYGYTDTATPNIIQGEVDNNGKLIFNSTAKDKYIIEPFKVKGSQTYTINVSGASSASAYLCTISDGGDISDSKKLGAKTLEYEFKNNELTITPSGNYYLIVAMTSNSTPEVKITSYANGRPSTNNNLSGYEEVSYTLALGSTADRELTQTFIANRYKLKFDAGHSISSEASKTSGSYKLSSDGTTFVIQTDRKFGEIFGVNDNTKLNHIGKIAKITATPLDKLTSDSGYINDKDSEKIAGSFSYLTSVSDIAELTEALDKTEADGTIPVLYGYIFMGWGLEDQGTTDTYKSSVSNLSYDTLDEKFKSVWTESRIKGDTNVASDIVENANNNEITLYAYYTPLHIDIEFYQNYNGDYSTAANEKAADTIGKFYDAAYAALPIVYRDGYIFEGWSTGPDYRELTYDSSSGSYNSSGAVDAIRVINSTDWTLKNSKYNASNIDDIKSENNSDTKKQVHVSIFSNTNDYVKSAGTTNNNKYISKDTSSLEAGTIDLFAIWTPNTYIVTYKLVCDDDTSTMPARYNGSSDDIKLVTEYDDYYGNAYVYNADYEKYKDRANFANDYSSYNWITSRKKFVNTTGATDAANLSLLPQPTRQGYTFGGWYTEPNVYTLNEDGTPVAVSGELITSGTTLQTAKDHTLYAYWIPCDYDVYFDANGGTVVGMLESISVVVDKPYGVLPEAVRDGYVFKGWTLEKEGGKYITETTNVTTPEEHTLYAQWEALKDKAVYVLNGGKSSSTEKEVTFGSPYGTLATPTRSGYSFDGWFLEKDLKTLITSETLVSTEGTHNLYAGWSPNNYTVTFSIGTDGTCYISSKIVTYDALYGTLPTPYAKNKDFVGWKLNGSTVTSSTKVATAKNHTLTAEWKTNSAGPWTLTFNANGGYFNNSKDKSSIATVSMKSSTSTYGAVKWYSDSDVTNPGYKLVGWTLNPETNELVLSTDKYTIHGSQTLYAVWAAKSITVTFDPNGGTCSMSSTSVQYGETYGTLPTPKKDNAIFLGWSIDSATNDTSKYIYYDTEVEDYSDHTLVANWQDSIPVTVTYDYMPDFYKYSSTSDKLNGNSVLSQTVYTNQTYSYSSTGKVNELPTPTLEGYVFTGWYTDYAYDNATLVTSSTKVTITKDHTLYARWSSKNTVVVTFEGNGGTVKYETLTYEKGSSYGTGLIVPTRKGYTFKGWYKSQNFIESNKVTITSKVADASHTLYASWEANTYVVTFNPGANALTNIETKDVTFGKIYGTLPTPTYTVINGDTGLSVSYNFVGWFTSSGEKITEDTVVETASNHTLYAKWLLPSYTIKYQSNGGTGTPETQVKYSDQDIQLTEKQPSKTGYTFNGWTSSSDTLKGTYTIGGKTYPYSWVYSEDTELNISSITVDKAAINITGSDTKIKITVSTTGTASNLSYQYYIVDENNQYLVLSSLSASTSCTLDIKKISGATARTLYAGVDIYDNDTGYSASGKIGIIAVNSLPSIYVKGLKIVNNTSKKEAVMTATLNKASTITAKTISSLLSNKLTTTTAQSGTNTTLTVKDSLDKTYSSGSTYSVNCSALLTAKWKLNAPTKTSIDDTNIYVKDGASKQTIEANVTGAELKYQWYRTHNGSTSMLSGANSSKYTIENISSSMQGDTYYCKVTNSAGGVDSDTRYLVVYKSPTVSMEEKVTVDVNHSIKIKATITKDGTPATYVYSWYEYNPVTNYSKLLPGESGSTLTVIGTAENNGRSYYCKINNGGYTTTSSKTLLEVTGLDSLYIVSDEDKVVKTGDTVKFKIELGGKNYGSVNIQWQKRDAYGTWQTLSGETKTTLTLKNVTSSDSGTQYRAYVSASNGDEAYSEIMNLTVEEQLYILATETSGKIQCKGNSSVSSFNSSDYEKKATSSTYKPYYVSMYEGSSILLKTLNTDDVKLTYCRLSAYNSDGTIKAQQDNTLSRDNVKIVFMNGSIRIDNSSVSKSDTTEYYMLTLTRALTNEKIQLVIEVKPINGNNSTVSFIADINQSADVGTALSDIKLDAKFYLKYTTNDGAYKLVEVAGVEAATSSSGTKKSLNDIKIVTGTNTYYFFYTITINGKTTTLKTTAEITGAQEASKIKSIKIASYPTKTSYMNGEAFATDGLVVKAVLNDNTEYTIYDYTYPERIIFDKDTLNSGDSNKAGNTVKAVTKDGVTTYTITISYTKDNKTYTATLPITKVEGTASYTTVSFNESYSIANVYFKSAQYSEKTEGTDKNGNTIVEGWTKVTLDKDLQYNNIEDLPIIEIKNGYGFQLKVYTNYRTNRATGTVSSLWSSNIWETDTGYSSVYPTVTPVTNPDILYAKVVKIKDEDSDQWKDYAVSFDTARTDDSFLTLEKTDVDITGNKISEGYWYNSTKIFEFEERELDNGTLSRNAFTSIGSSGEYLFMILSPAWYGYDPEEKPNSYYIFEDYDTAGENMSKSNVLQVCSKFIIKITANGDVNTHILQ